MSGALAFRSYIALIVGIDRSGQGEVIDDPDALRAQGRDLRGIVGHQAYACEAQVTEDGGGRLIASLVGGEAQVEVGVQGIQAGVL